MYGMIKTLTALQKNVSDTQPALTAPMDSESDTQLVLTALRERV